MNSKNILLILGIFLILTIGCVNVSPPGTTTGDQNNPQTDENNPTADGNNPATDQNNSDGNAPATGGSIIDQIIANRDQNNPVVEKTVEEKLAECQALTGEEQGNCLKDLAIAEEKAEVCTEIKESGIRDNCVHVIALKKSEIQLCATVSEVSLKDSCIKSIIFTTQAWDQ